MAKSTKKDPGKNMRAKMDSNGPARIVTKLTKEEQAKMDQAPPGVITGELKPGNKKK